MAAAKGLFEEEIPFPAVVDPRTGGIDCGDAAARTSPDPRRELARLSAALADGASLPSVLGTIREREARHATIGDELAACDGDSLGDAFAALVDVLPKARRRLQEWQTVLSEETAQSRQMLRILLEGRIVFTPRPELPAVDFAGRGDYGRIFVGLIGSQALASPAGTALLGWGGDHAARPTATRGAVVKIDGNGSAA